MKIAISSTGRSLISEMDPRFGRAAYFLMIDSETLEFEVVENVQNLDRPQGAGIQAGKTIIDNQAELLITGNCGPKAFQVLKQAGVGIVTNAKGRVADAFQSYKKGEFKTVDAPNVEGHWV
ncbi:MAG: dinitrogenase iron-molybdenum cofactor biosynthesis protein [Proteobacteria bacterium]|nr:dinitrogenase iron-molybdenum cofactor biosynthesis protein [Pseudomonadota bacterium]